MIYRPADSPIKPVEDFWPLETDPEYDEEVEQDEVNYYKDLMKQVAAKYKGNA